MLIHADVILATVGARSEPT